jgi:RND family efflux transporter MFP subunit
MTNSAFKNYHGIWTALASLMMLLAIAVFPLGSALAHGGEDHGDEKPAANSAIGPRIDAQSDLFELVGVPSARDDGILTVYLHDFRTNAPVTDASVELTTGDATLAGTAVNGAFTFKTPWVIQPGHYDLTFSITAGDRSDLLIGRLDIPEPPPQDAAHDSIWDHLWPSTWNIAEVPLWAPIGTLALAALMTLAALRIASPLRGALLAFAAIMGLSSVAVAATVITSGAERADSAVSAATLLDVPDTSKRLEDGAIFVPKTAQRLFGVQTIQAAQSESIPKTVRLIGQVIPDPNRSGLVQALLAGRIEPPDTGFPAVGSAVRKGDVLGYVIPRVEVVDQSDIRQTQGDLDRQIELAEAKLKRIEPLGGGAVPQAQVTDARIELEALRKRRATIKPVLAEKEVLIAPADGVLAQMNVAAGQVVEAQTLLFQIVDPANLWVEALAFDTAVATRIEKSARDAVASTADGRKFTLSFAGRGIALRQQAVPLRFKVNSGQNDLSVGEPVTVEAPIDESVSSIPVPRAAVVRASNGQNIVFSHSGPERFEQQIIEVVPIDADRVGITAGLTPGARVVTRGTELINQVR